MRGGGSSQRQMTEDADWPVLKVTRIHVGVFHTCMSQPGSGVAETSSADWLPTSKTTRPPATVAPCREPEGGGLSVSGGVRDVLGPVGPGSGLPACDVAGRLGLFVARPVSGADDETLGSGDGFGRWVEEARGGEGELSRSETGSAGGGS